MSTHPVVPPQEAEPLATWLRSLLTRGNEPSTAERDAVVRLGQAAAPGLIAVLTDDELSRQGSPGNGLGPVRAAGLLSELQAEEAIRPLLDLLLECDPMEVLYSTIIHALQDMGDAVVEPLLAALPADTLQQRVALCEVLSHLGVRDPRIFAALASLLREDIELGASFMATYGDEAALPLLLDSLDRYELRRADVGVLGDAAIGELAVAIEELGGALTESQQRKLRRAETWQSQARREVLERRESTDTATAAAKPGRNDPCWCGSGVKYKKCHWMQAGDQARE